MGALRGRLGALRAIRVEIGVIGVTTGAFGVGIWGIRGHWSEDWGY